MPHRRTSRPATTTTDLLRPNHPAVERDWPIFVLDDRRMHRAASSCIEQPQAGPIHRRYVAGDVNRHRQLAHKNQRSTTECFWQQPVTDSPP